MKTIKKQSIQAFFLGIAIATGITLTSAAIAAISLSGESLNMSDINNFSTAAATQDLVSTSIGPVETRYYQKTRYYQVGIMTREKYDDGCYYNFNNVDMSNENTLNQTKTGAIKLVVADPGGIKRKIKEIINEYNATISRENATKNSYEVIIHTAIDQFDDLIDNISILTEDKNIEKITCSENVTIPMVNTQNDLQKMQIWASRYQRIFDLKVAEFDRAHESELVHKLQQLENAEAQYQNYQQQVEALQERADFLKNTTDRTIISIFVIETTEDEKVVDEMDFGDWLVKTFIGQG